jgi:hypothetical protein
MNCLLAAARATMRARLLILLLASAACCRAAPDPDLFDGRIAAARERSDAGGSPAAGGSGDRGSEHSPKPVARDDSEVGDPAGSQPVAEASSKSAGSPASAGDSTAAEGRDYGSLGQLGGGESVAPAGAKSPASGGAAAGTPASERNFEDFGFGAQGQDSAAVEVKRSKDAGAPPATIDGTPKVSGPSSPSVAEASKSGVGAGVGGSVPSTPSGSGDFGSNLPSGL